MTTDHAAAATTKATTAPATRGTRLFFVDNLRTFLTILVVLHHLAITYAVVAPWYYVEYREPSLATAVGLMFVLANQAYFMGFFFLISGYFTPGSVDRKGVGRFVKDRLIRLGIPVVVFMLGIAPLIGRFLSPYADLPPGWKPPASDGATLSFLRGLDPGPLWFAELLLLLALGYAVWRAVRPHRPDHAPEAAVAAAGPPRYWAVGAFVLGLAVVTWLVRIALPIGFSLPVVGWPTPAYLPQYVGLFVVGLVAYRRGWFHAVTDRMGKLGLVAALGATVLVLPLALVGADGMVGGLNVHAFAYALWDSTFAVGICLFLLTLFRKRLNAQGRLRRFASDHAFAVYVLHAPVIVALAVAVRGIDIAPALKFFLVAPFAIAACFAVAYLVRRIPGVRRVL